MNGVRRRVAIAASGVVLSAGIGAGTGIWAYDMSQGPPAATTAAATVATATPAATRSLAAADGSTGLTAGQIYSAAAAGVVEIQVTSRAPGAGGLQAQGGATEAQGSGFVIDDQGHIVTNDHVVNGATAISVIFNDGTRAAAKLVGSDASSDLAVIKVDAGAAHLTPLQLADSDQVRVGDEVVAISSPFGLENTTTAGIVSALNRTIQSINGYTIAGVIQTDASINHGSSGSPLLDDHGHVIGVNSQIEGGNVDGNVGVGFAIPSTTVRKVVDQLIAGTPVAHPYLGVQLTTASAIGAANAAPGATVAAVASGSPAAKAGLVRGDVITAVNGTAATSADDVTAAIVALEPGQKVTLQVTRGGSSRTVSVTLGQLPE
jgi:putative serine protease PepD